MKRISTILSCSALTIASLAAFGSHAFADDKYYIDESNSQNQSKANANDVSNGLLKNEGIGIKPMVGVLTSSASNTTLSDSRLATGFALDFNLTRLVTANPSLYVGPQTGFIYSRAGGTDFIGGGDAPNSNIFIVPADAKVGMNIGDNLRLSAHGGANLAHFDAGLVQADSTWKFYPNVGGDAELGVSKNLSVLVRPDWSFTGGDTLFVGTVGIGLLIG